MRAIPRIIQGVVDLGKKAVSWVKSNYKAIQDWINAGMSVDWIIQKVRGMFGG